MTRLGWPGRQWWMAPLALGFLLFSALMLLRPASEALLATISYGVRTGTVVLACALMLRRARRGDRRLRRARRLLAAALALGALSGVLAAAHQVLAGGPPPVPSVADAAYFLLLPFAVAGLLAYPATGVTDGSRARALLEGAIAAAGLWVATYVVLLAPAGVGGGLGPLASVTVLSYPASDVLLIALAMSILPRVDDQARGEVLLSVCGLSLLALSDVAYSVLQAEGRYRPDSWVAVVGELGLLLIVVAALRPPYASAGRLSRRYGVALLYAPAAVVLGVGALGVVRGGGLPLPALSGLLVLVLVLVLRQAVAARDNGRLLAHLTAREDLFRSLVTGSSDLITLHDADGRVLYASPAAARALGRPEQEVLGTVLGDVTHPDDLPATERAWAEVLSAPGARATIALRARDGQDGSWRWMEAVAQNMLDNPNVRGVVCNTRDVNERVLLEQSLLHAAFHDALTGLPNRRALTERVEEVLSAGGHGSLLWLDLDGFKEINDALGHKVGDEVLREVGRRLEEMVREPDLVGRLGGDEFVIFCDAGEAHALVLAERVGSVLRAPIEMASGLHTISASIGVAVTPAVDASSLFAAADVAMYEAKAQGRGVVRLFDARMFSEVQDRLALTRDLRSAVDGGQLRLHYQPIMNLDSGDVHAVEALVRWEHPTRGLVQPGAFVQLAEQNGLIVQLGRWVLDTACAQLAAWQHSAPTGRPLRVAVNLAARQLTDPALVSHLRDTLLATGADPSLLTLEVTESSVMEDVGAAIRTLDELRRLGVRLAVDDFGTGYSSLTYLKQFPVHEVKLDKSFIDGVGVNADDSAIVAAVVNLARAIDLEIVAEGVETTRQHGLLRALGCDYGQGYLWHRPAPPDELEPWLTSWRPSAHPRGLAAAGEQELPRQRARQARR